MPVPEAPINDGEHGRRAAGPGWFVLNLGDAAGRRNSRAGIWTDLEPPSDGFEHFGINVHVVMPGQANCVYHEESHQEDFLVLHGECIAIVEERRAVRDPHDRRARPGDRIEYPASEVAARHER
jgi:hypothetical protein